jgi:hypothetical protein
MNRIGLLISFLGIPYRKSSVPRYRYRLRSLQVMCGATLVAVLAFGLQGCSDSSRQGSELAYAGPSEYANYGYSSDPFAYGPYDPLLYSYWYPQQYYYYPNYGGDGDHDCDDGHCGGPRGGHRPPSPIFPRPLATAPRPMTATRESSAGGFRSGGASASGFHGGFNGGTGGFGGSAGFASHGSSHR